MTQATLLRRSLIHYWRTHLAVLCGVATAVAVLAGALLVGESVRASLRNLFLSRLGNTAYVISSTDFFPDERVSELAGQPTFSGSFAAASPLIALEGVVIHEESGRRSSRVEIYGVDERFWRFHGLESASLVNPTGRDVLLTESVARELQASPEDTILLRVEQPYDVPAEFLHGRRDQTGRTIRLAAGESLSALGIEAFSLRPQQGDVHAAFVPLRRLQVDLDQEGRVNTILVSDVRDVREPNRENVLAGILGETLRLEDLGVTLEVLEDARCLSVTSPQILIGDDVADAVRESATRLGLDTSLIFTYLANTMRSGSTEVPYSLVSALDASAFDALQTGMERLPFPDPSAGRAIVLNDWAALDLVVRLGDPLTLDYYVWTDDGRLESRSADFVVSGIVPIEGAAGDPDLAPAYPGITDADAVSDWDPPFPIDLERVRPKDEEYWELYRATPKAFIPLATGQELWRSRYGALTSIRAFPSEGGEHDLAAARDRFAAALRETLEPTAAGWIVHPVRAEGLRASQGATDFGEYFVYFSFFLVVAAILLTALFFRLGVEQRLTEIGILGAIGFPAKTVRRLLLSEGVVLAALGSVMGLVGAIVYAEIIMFGLRTWWVDAVGTRLLTLHASPSSLLLGAGGGILAAVASIAWTLRTVRPLTPRGLLSGAQIDTRVSPEKKRRARVFAIVAAAAAGVLLSSTWLGAVGPAGGFFGAGSLLLLASLAALWSRLAAGDGELLTGRGSWAVSRLGFRNVTYRPGRSLLCVSLIAFATFVIVAVDAFRRDDREASLDPRSGTGGYPLMAESLLPVLWNPNSEQGREALGLTGEDVWGAVRFEPFRVRRGDDASCLNLYRPQSPEIMAPGKSFLQLGRFGFSSALSETSQEEENPWLILERREPDGAIPVIGDANSMTYVLHLDLGDVMEIERVGQAPLRLRLVAMLRDSIFQGELLMSEGNFHAAFPEEDGYRFFLLDVPPESTDDVIVALEERLADSGVDVVATSERLASFHRVENTYLSTFQTLGGLGLVLGTFGLAAVLLRNVLERRRELALLRAVGYRSRDFSLMVLAENAVLLLWGLASGTLSALVAIAPALALRGGAFSLAGLSWLLLAVVASGIVASLLAVAASVRAPLLESLRAE